jgi:hypothetical protein
MDPDAHSPAFRQWQGRQQPIASMAAAGIGTGFGLGFALGGLFLWTLVGAFAGVGIGVVISKRSSQVQNGLAAKQQ